MSPSFKIAYVPWWNPRPLMQKHDKGFDQIGWVWRQQARLVKNQYHGWIAFADEQTELHLRTCPCCNKPTKETP